MTGTVTAGFAARLAELDGVREAHGETFEFAGSRAASGPLTWGQAHMHDVLEFVYPHSSLLNSRSVVELRDGVSTPEVLASLRAMVERFETFRTVYAGGDGEPVQHVLQSGVQAVDVVDVAPDVVTGGRAALVAVVGAVLDTLAADVYEVPSDLPLRLAVVTVDGQPRVLVVVSCHLATDHTGLRRLPAELGDVAAGQDGVIPPVGRQPMEQAAIERSPAGLRSADRALRHAENVLRAMPQTMLPRAARAVEAPRFRNLSWESRLLALTVPWLAQRHDASTTAVLYAGLGAVAAHANGLTTAVMNLISVNRTERATLDAVGNFSQEVYALVDLGGDIDLAEAVARSHKAVLRALMNGRFSVHDRFALRERVAAERGMHLDTSATLNYIPSPANAVAAAVAPTAEALRAAAAETTWGWSAGDDRSGSSFFLHVEDGDPFRVRMLVDTTLVPPAEAVVWLRSIEQLFAHAVTGPVRLRDLASITDLRAPVRGPRWTVVDGTPVDLDAVEAAVRRVLPAADVSVAVDGGRLVAHVSEVPDGVDLRARCRAEIAGDRTAVAPHAFVVP